MLIQRTAATRWCTISSAKTLKYSSSPVVLLLIVAPIPKCVRDTLLYMFRSKRTILTKRLWKLRLRGSCVEHEDDEATGEDENCRYELRVRGGLLKRLAEHQLEMLVAAVEGRGADLSSSACVLMPRIELPTPSTVNFVHPSAPKATHSSYSVAQPHVAACRLWRWPSLRDATQLRRLPGCRSSKDPVYICINPYHWSRLTDPESPPPPYCRYASECLKPEDRAPSEGSCNPLRGDVSWSVTGSLTTSGEGDSRTREWCRLAYWELSSRVGRQFPVVPEAVNVFTCMPHGDGLSLATLAEAAPWPPPDSVRRTRVKIGLGVTLSLEADGIWVYNRSEGPIFVNSPWLDAVHGRSLFVCRVKPGHCLNIFDRTRYPPRVVSSVNPIGPVDPNSVRISFAKGWGPHYSRQEVTACPCWLEVLLIRDPCR